MQTILGANGSIARELSKALAASTLKIRQVSRNPRKVHEGDETVVADLLDGRSTADAVSGSEVVYLVAGLQYNTAVWQDQWPRVMRNVIDACKRHGARLVFFDNVYAYGRVEGLMTEETPFNPISQKGEVRAKVATLLLDEIRRGNLQALIARSADFYGPGDVQGILQTTVFQRIRAGKPPQWLGTPRALHSFTFTPDAGSAVAVLGNSVGAFGQSWHLPTCQEPLTGQAFVRLACEAAGQPFRLQEIPGWMRKFLGLFVTALHENEEMMYQFEHDYRFGSGKIESAYGVQPTAYKQGIELCVGAGR
jgi:nucleoside-diphosphate-sugar epimerase